MDGTYLEYLREDLLKLSPSGKLLAIYSPDELLTIVNCADGKTISQRHIPNVQRICWDPESLIVTRSKDNIIIWDIKLLFSHTIHCANRVISLVFSDNGNYMIVGENDGPTLGAIKLKIYNHLGICMGMLDPVPSPDETDSIFIKDIYHMCPIKRLLEI